jgi:hypothetical protein
MHGAEAQLSSRVKPLLEWLHVRAPHALENPGYLTPDRAGSYAATQEIVVPKGGVYARVLNDLPWLPGGELRLAEFGFGTGEFLERLILGCIERRQVARLLAFDLSSEMGRIAKERLDRVLAASSASGASNFVSVSLVTGVNCLDPEFTWPELQPDSFSAAVQLQFAHYAPNSPESWLARKAEEDGVQKLDKGGWLARLASWLRPGGRLLEFDDFDQEVWFDNELSLTLWDISVLQNLVEPRVQREIAQKHPKLSHSILKVFSKRGSFEETVRAVERNRRKRRTLCREETVTLKAYLGLLSKAFGEGNTSIMETGLGVAHQRFQLLRTTKLQTAEEGAPGA